ncbi:MAG: hypothetical protein R3E68_12880 [Burkholderiaceae bacterium]
MRRQGYRLDEVSEAVDEFDFRQNAQIYGAFDKSAGRLLGTIRLILGDQGPNEISSQAMIPEPWRSMTKIDARRYVVPRGRHAMQVKVMLMKALYEVASQRGIQAIVAASSEALASAYRMMHFQDVLPGGLSITPTGAHKAVTVVAINVAALKGLWQTDKELATFYRLWFETRHPDLLLQPERRVNDLSALRPAFEFVGPVMPAYPDGYLAS